MPRTPEEMREYQAARRTRLKAMKELDQDKPALPGEKEALEPTYIDAKTNVVQLVDSLKRRRGRARLTAGSDGERLGDGLADTSVLVANMDPAARDAILEGMRTGSPEPWRRYLASRGK